MKKKIAVLAGDGIGPEIMKEALKVLQAITPDQFELTEGLIGGAAWDAYGHHFPKETENLCQNADAILFGAVGGPPSRQSEPKWKDCERASILSLRKRFGFNVNLRPIRVYSALKRHCVLRGDIVEQGIDILCVRELSGGIYFGEHRTRDLPKGKLATDIMVYDERTIERVAHAAFQAAQKRRHQVTSVDKANVLDCSRLWREVVERVSQEYPDCRLEHILVDNASMQLLVRPHSFDVLLMPNMFGDIFSDQVTVFSGSLGMLPSASLNGKGFGLFEPSGGSAPDIAGTGRANPIGQILSMAMMLKYSFGMNRHHDAVVEAVERCLDGGLRTPDLCTGGGVSTIEMGDAIAEIIMREKWHEEDAY